MAGILVGGGEVEKSKKSSPGLLTGGDRGYHNGDIMPKTVTVTFDSAAFERAVRSVPLTFAEVKRLAQCSQATVWNARHGRRIGVGIASRLATVLRVHVSDLLKHGIETGDDVAEVAGVPSNGEAA